MLHKKRVLPRYTSKRRSSFHYLLALGLLSSYLIVCIMTSSCRSTTANTSGSSPSHPTPISTPPHSVLLTPTSTATSTPSSPSSPAQTISPTPTLTPLTAEEVVKDAVQHYVLLVLEQHFRQAYNRLDVNLRDQEPYDDFVRNADYTLRKGCWQVFWDQIDVVQVDDHTWVAAIPLTQVTCVDGTTLQKYIWFFRIHMDDGPPEIIAIALDKTTSAN